MPAASSMAVVYICVATEPETIAPVIPPAWTIPPILRTHIAGLSKLREAGQISARDVANAIESRMPLRWRLFTGLEPS